MASFFSFIQAMQLSLLLLIRNANYLHITYGRMSVEELLIPADKYSYRLE